MLLARRLSGYHEYKFDQLNETVSCNLFKANQVHLHIQQILPPSELTKVLYM